MKNAFKCQHTNDDASCSSRRRPRTNEAITRASSDDGRDSTLHSPEEEPAKEHPWAFCAQNIKIAPIFLPRTVSKHGTNGRIGQQKEDFPSRIEREQQVTIHQDAKHSCDPTHGAGRHRGRLPPPDVTRCLEEIQTSNPGFPARTAFSNLQEKSSALCSAQHSQQTVQALSSQQNHSEYGRPERVPKRPRLDRTAGRTAAVGDCPASAQGGVERAARSLLQPRSSRLSRTRRLKQLNASGLINKSESQSDKTLNDPQRDVILETLLWTDKYSPQNSSEVIGNAASVKKLQSWLKKWKQKAVCDETRAPEEKEREDSSAVAFFSDVWDCGDFRGETEAEGDGGRPLCNTVLITGPPGVGKTASVYACAQELGFKVFEVNCSSLRSGCHVLAQLKEATQSHLVEISGKDPLKPAYFSNYTTAQKPESLLGKTLRPKNVSATSKKRAAQKLGRSGLKQKPSQAAATLADFFKVKAKADPLHSGGLLLSAKADDRTAGRSSSGPDGTKTRHKKTATSLILFEEVDVIFDDDVGFLSAIKTFMLTTKRPVVLTTNDPSFKERFNCRVMEITFKVPAKANVCSYLQLVALAEGTRLKFSDGHDLLRLSGGDVRRCLLQLQLWASSGAGQVLRRTCGRRTLIDVSECSSAAEEQRKNADQRLSKCYTGCAATMLGLPSITPDQLLDIVKSPPSSEVETTQLQQLLAESLRWGVSLLYSNLGLLLPTQDTEDLCKPSGDSPSSDSHIQLPTRAHAVRKSSKLSRRRRHPLVDTTTSSSSGTQRTSAGGGSSRRDGTGQTTAACLDALMDFFDCMSFHDATAPPVPGPCGPETFVWTGAETHDGMLDEMRAEEEEEKSWSRSQERLLDIRAAVEDLSCRECLKRVCGAWGGNQRSQQEVARESPGWPPEGLTSPSSSERPDLNFGFQPTSASRYKLSRTLLSQKPFGLLGNRDAVTADYMPTLRFLCRLQKSQQQKDEPDGFLCYLNNTHLGLSESTIQLLAKDFSENSLEISHMPPLPLASKQQRKV